MLKPAGFTLIEIMITIALVALLASIAFPAYTQYAMRGRLVEAQSELLSKGAELEQHFQDNRSYVGYDCSANDTENFTYSCTTQTATTYVLQADGRPDSTMDAFVLTLNSDSDRATIAVPEGWQTANNCWIVRKNGSC